MILLIGDGSDPHLAAIRAELADLNSECAIFSTSRGDLLQSGFSWSSTEEGDAIRLWQGGRMIESAQVDAAFCLEPIFSGGAFVPDQNEQFWYRSWKESLYGFFDELSLRGALVNGPISNAIARQNKLSLHRFARATEMKIPPAAVSCRRADLHAFFAGRANVVLKSLHQMPLEHHGTATMLLTTAVEESTFAEFSDQGECPLFLQERVPKLFDVRVLCVGAKTVACKIDASRSMYGALDWRAYDLPRTVHQSMTLPTHVAAKTSQLIHRMGLDYACVDFCVDSDDQYWLLDVNPFGRYLWMEHATGQQMSATIANHLLHRAAARKAVS